MASATIKGSPSLVKTLLDRANVVLGYPKKGLSANEAVQHGGGIHVPSDTVVTVASTDVSTDTANGETYLLVTDRFRTTLTTVVADAQARIDAKRAIAGDTEIVALVEQPVTFGDGFPEFLKGEA